MPKGYSESKNMSNWEFGLTLTVFGMGGTLIILFLISVVMDVLIKFLPYREEAKK
jgi:Na+-transporting methylmalonyl-CoA/oxaloacetate decarboxylase gamma subunit